MIILIFIISIVENLRTRMQKFTLKCKTGKKQYFIYKNSKSTNNA